VLADGLGSATFAYYVRGDGSGGVTYNGTNYYTLADYMTATPVVTGVSRSVASVSSADFSGGTVTTGSVTQFVVVPEPGAVAIAGIGVGLAAWAMGRHRRRRV
jgi:hypothetical protein